MTAPRAFARHEDHCVVCDGDIDIGEQLVWDERLEEWIHEECES